MVFKFKKVFPHNFLLILHSWKLCRIDNKKIKLKLLSKVKKGFPSNVLKNNHHIYYLITLTFTIIFKQLTFLLLFYC